MEANMTFCISALNWNNVDKSYHALHLPGDDTASIMKGPSSVLSDTLQEPQTHASPLHCPVRVSSVPVRTNKNLYIKINFDIL